MPRSVYLLGLGLLLVAGAFLITDSLLWRPGVTEANLRRVREGMTLAAVQATLGEPGALERDIKFPLPPDGRVVGELHAREWAGDRGRILVWFDAGRAYAIECAIWPRTYSPLEAVRKQTGW
jgi:hypothetical protein